jgi:hypothetical protein
MRKENKSNRVMMTGVRKGGEPDYHFKIFGNDASQFPPLMLKMSLHEMQQWLREMQTLPTQALQGRHRLRSVG